MGLGNETALAYGENLRPDRAVGSFKVTVRDDQKVELVASLLPDPMIRAPEHLPATTVAIHMDQSVAMVLFSQLRETFQTMGWPLPEEAE